MKKYIIGIVLLVSGNIWAQLTPTIKQALAEKYAPLLRLHKKEPSYPASVPWYLARVNLKKRDGDQTQLISNNPTPQMLANLPDIARNYFLVARNKKKTFKGMPPKNGVATAPTYVNIVELDNGTIELQYMFFYPNQEQLPILPGLNKKIFNLLKKVVPTDKIGIHEADWEHLSVYLNKIGNSGNPDQDYKLYQIFYARHQQKQGDLRRPDQVEFVDNNMKRSNRGTHPVVWVGKNSHAGYPKQVSLSTDVDITSLGGIEWPTWRNVQIVGPLDNPNPGMEWIKARKLRWGSTTAASKYIPLLGKKIEYHGNSPTTPSSSGWYGVAGLEKRPIKKVILKTKSKKGRNSDYFNLEIPARFKNIEFVIHHRHADQIKFDMYEYKYGGALIKDKRIYKNIIGPTTIKKVPSNNVIKNAYLKNLKIPDSIKKTTPEIEVEILGIEGN